MITVQVEASSDCLQPGVSAGAGLAPFPGRVAPWLELGQQPTAPEACGERLCSLE